MRFLETLLRIGRQEICSVQSGRLKRGIEEFYKELNKETRKGAGCEFTCLIGTNWSGLRVPNKVLDYLFEDFNGVDPRRIELVVSVRPYRENGQGLVNNAELRIESRSRGQFTPLSSIEVSARTKDPYYGVFISSDGRKDPRILANLGQSSNKLGSSTFFYLHNEKESFQAGLALVGFAREQARKVFPSMAK